MSKFVCRFCERGECGRCSSTDCICCGDANDYYAVQASLERAWEDRSRHDRFEVYD